MHPGFAGTPIPEHFDNLQDLIFLYLDLIDELNLENTILAGFSMGGWLAAEIAAINTKRFSKLILVDSVGKALRLMEVLQSEREITLKVEREGKPVQFHYYID